MMGISPLRDLAYLNVKHWQSQSDQDTILHVARVPILAISAGTTTRDHRRRRLGGEAADGGRTQVRGAHRGSH
jgi:hypothetical protein